ncbi:MAG: WecB/TagA/CpsF family glycosyltransferase [Cellvibrionaceae bacterium]|nr:WecB/TagA/CpsF family glycosyltransferase [Cellvibrionaceae bacterium]
MSRIELLNCPMDNLTMAATVSKIDDAIGAGEFTQHVVVNVAKLVQMRDDPQLREAVEQCDIINIDGMGVLWGGKLLGLPVTERVAGVDLFFALNALAEQRGYRVFYLGATEQVVEHTVREMQGRHPELMLAGYLHGYFWDDEQAVVEKIRQSRANLLFVAISSPKKETFINRWREQLGVEFVMGVGGTFDVVAGKVTRAPQWMQNCGLEWLYRLLQEPGRMWRRYLFSNSVFACLLLKAKWRQRFGRA